MIIRILVILILSLSAVCGEHFEGFAVDRIKPRDRVGIFIGTFDPLTRGHESVINDALNRKI